MDHDPHETASYRSIDITRELHGRLALVRDETPTLLALAERIAETPDESLQALVDSAMDLTQAQSAGVSIADSSGPEEVFRWVATAGRFGPFLGSTLPRRSSPCGDVLRTQKLLLMHQPARHYGQIQSLGLPVHEALLSPIWREGTAIGTVWVVHHDGLRSFDAEDARILTSLTQFVGDTADLLERLSFGTAV